MMKQPAGTTWLQSIIQSNGKDMEGMEGKQIKEEKHKRDIQSIK